MDSAVPTQLPSALAAESGIQLALLFGSRARGRAHSRSDIDIAVRAPGVDLAEVARRVSLTVGLEVDLVDLDNVGYPMLRELVMHGIVIVECARGNAARWRSHAIATLEMDRRFFERMRDAYLSRAAREG